MLDDTNVTRMSTEYGVDYFDGEERQRLVVSGDFVLSDIYQGGVHIEAGQFQLEGVIQGSLDVQTGVQAVIRGKQQGSVSVSDAALVVVTGSIEGSVNIERGGRVIVETGGEACWLAPQSGRGHRSRRIRRHDHRCARRPGR